MNFKILLLPLILSVLVLTNSCTPSKLVIIKTEPPGAQVYIDGNNHGQSPVNTKLIFPSSSPNRIVTVQAPGYENGTAKITFPPKDLVEYTVRLEKKEVVNIDLISFEPLQTNAGVKLVRVKRSSLSYLDQIERSPSVKSVTRVTQNEESTFQIGRPIMSPIDNSFVYQVYAEEEGGKRYCNIWGQGVGGVAKRRITYGASIDLFPAFTSDGSFIYFSSNRISENPTLWRTKVEGGGGLTAITKTQSEDFAPCVIAGDQMIVYTSLPPKSDEPQIWLVNETGTLNTQLREGELPSVSPDGKRIIYQRKDVNTTFTRDSTSEHPYQLWMMNLDGSGETQLTQNSTYHNIHPQWSPDGKYIVYSSDKGQDGKKRHNWDIWMMKADGTGETQLTINGSWDDSPSWSYDGTRIYFRSNRGGYWNIWYFEPYMNK